MTTMIAEVYDAFVSAGADEAKARRAAEVLTEFDDRFAQVDRRFDQLERRLDGVDRSIDLLETNMKAEFSLLRGDMNGRFNLLYWMFGILVAGTVSIVLRLFLHA